MNTVADIKKFILKVLAQWAMPVPDAHLLGAVNTGFTPRPLLSDYHDARRDLEEGGFIQGAKDDLDESLVTWTLTDKGRHKAKQLG